MHRILCTSERQLRKRIMRINPIRFDIANEEAQPGGRSQQSTHTEERSECQIRVGGGGSLVGGERRGAVGEPAGGADVSVHDEGFVSGMGGVGVGFGGEGDHGVERGEDGGGAALWAEDVVALGALEAFEGVGAVVVDKLLLRGVSSQVRIGWKVLLRVRCSSAISRRQFAHQEVCTRDQDRRLCSRCYPQDPEIWD